MKVAEVPQDQDPTFEGGKKLCYAIDESGKFVAVKTSGWNVEAEAKDLAWQAIHRDLAETLKRMKAGQASSLEYHMKLRQMNIPLLAQNAGTNPLRVWWHLKPSRFARLNDKWLSRYADVLSIPLETLRDFKGP